MNPGLGTGNAPDFPGALCEPTSVKREVLYGGFLLLCTSLCPCLGNILLQNAELCPIYFVVGLSADKGEGGGRGGGVAAGRVGLDIFGEKERNHRPSPPPISIAPRNFILRSGPPLSDLVFHSTLTHDAF